MFAETVTNKYKDSDNVDIEKSISTITVSTAVDSTSRRRKIFALDCISAGEKKLFFVT